jgi:hypothetical protein
MRLLKFFHLLFNSENSNVAFPPLWAQEGALEEEEEEERDWLIAPLSPGPLPPETFQN